jgi:hypothetical protein
MLSSSPSKIHEPRVTGVSPRPTDRRQRQKTAEHESTSAAGSARWLGYGSSVANTSPSISAAAAGGRGRRDQLDGGDSLLHRVWRGVRVRVFHQVANLLNLEVDLLFFDTTSTFEAVIDRAQVDGSRARLAGHEAVGTRCRTAWPPTGSWRCDRPAPRTPCSPAARWPPRSTRSMTGSGVRPAGPRDGAAAYRPGSCSGTGCSPSTAPQRRCGAPRGDAGAAKAAAGRQRRAGSDVSWSRVSARAVWLCDAVSSCRLVGAIRARHRGRPPASGGRAGAGRRTRAR